MIVIKLGGSTLEKALQEPFFFQTIARAKSKIVLVHGGGPDITSLCEKLNLKTSFHEGLRVTSPEAMEATEMALSGKVNKNIVRALLKEKVQAVGISGVDSGLLLCDVENPNLGKVGKVKSVQIKLLNTLLDANFLPVVSPVGLFADGSSCNVNADLAASNIATALKAEKLLFVTDQDGIWDQDKKILKQIRIAELDKMSEQGILQGGMKVKARAICEMIRAAPTCRVEVLNGESGSFLADSLSGKTSGTLVTH